MADGETGLQVINYLPYDAGTNTVTLNGLARDNNAVGGTMDSSSSPADPLFWLHHANIDRLWVSWQQTHASKPKGSTVLQPPPLFGVKVSSQLDIAALGYSYA